MPRKFLFTKEQIVNAALELIRKKGMDALTARALGEELGSSAKPIFGLFENMRQVRAALKASEKKKWVCTPHPLYKLYRVLSKLLPDRFFIRFTRA